MTELIPLLSHLQAPASCSPFRLDRFSPLYTRGQELGVRKIRPTRAYYYVFPFGRRELSRLAYYFEYDFADGRDPADYAGELSREIGEWWRQHTEDEKEKPVLDAHRSNGSIVITDTRRCAVNPKHHLDGLTAEIYLLCDRARTLAGLAKELGDRAGKDEIAAELKELVSNKLAVHMDNRYLSLAVMRDRFAPADETEEANFCVQKT
jgi:hypothetical protein